MVGQRVGQVGTEGTAQLLAGRIRDVVRYQEHLAGHLAQQVEIFFIDIVKGALHRRKIGQLVGHGRKADALAEHHKLPPLCIPCQGHVVVDLFENIHVRHAPIALLFCL